VHDSMAGKDVTDVIANLERLSALRAAGALSDDEFAKLKADLLAADRPVGAPVSSPAVAPAPPTPPTPTVPPMTPDASSLLFRTDWEDRMTGTGTVPGGPQVPSQEAYSGPFGMPLPPPATGAPTPRGDGAREFELTCPACGTVWELEAADMAHREFTCEDCGCLIPTDEADPVRDFALMLVCPQCETSWELNQAAAELPEFTCEECGCRMPTS